MAPINPIHSGIGVLRRIGGNPLLERFGLKTPFEKLVYSGSKYGFRAATAGARSFKKISGVTQAQRPDRHAASGLFDLTPTEEQQMIREAVARFAAERLRPAAAQADADSRAPDGLLAEAAALGIASFSVPEAFGGAASEHSVVTGALIAESMAHGDLGLALASLAPVGVANVLTRWGSAEQQSRYLPAFAQDNPPAAALALVEPRALADPARPQTRVMRRGDGWALSGEKALVPLAETAELYLVSAVDEQGEVALYVVEPGDGLLLKPEPAMGLRAAELGTLRFDDMTLPEGARIDAAVMDYSRLAWCAMAVGTAQAVVDYVVPYVNDRQAFGEPISHRQAVAFGVADMALETEAMRLATWRAAALADQGKSFQRETALAYRLCCDKAMQIGSQGVQLLGGHGFVKEHPVERWYRDLRAIAVMSGGVCL